MAKITIDIKDEDLWSGIFGASPFTWEWWRSVDYVDGADWETPGVVLLGIENPDDERRTIVGKVDIDILAAAFSRAATLFPHRHFTIDDMDADLADVVLQIAILGEITYG